MQSITVLYTYHLYKQQTDKFHWIKEANHGAWYIVREKGRCHFSTVSSFIQLFLAFNVQRWSGVVCAKSHGLWRNLNGERRETVGQEEAYDCTNHATVTPPLSCGAPPLPIRSLGRIWHYLKFNGLKSYLKGGSGDRPSSRISSKWVRVSRTHPCKRQH